VAATSLSGLLPVKVTGRHYGENLARLDLLFSSLLHFAPSLLDELLVVVRGDEAEVIGRYLDRWPELPIRTIVEDEHFPAFRRYSRPWQVRPWQRQQVIKLNAPAMTDAEFVLTLDPDVLLLKPITRDLLVPGGRALLEPEARAVHARWWRDSADLLDVEPGLERRGITVTPAVLSTAILGELQRRLEAVGRRPWMDILLTSYCDWTEYTLYLLAAERAGLVEHHHVWAGEPGVRAHLHADPHLSIWSGSDASGAAIDRLFRTDDPGLFAVVQSNNRGLAATDVAAAVGDHLPVRRADAVVPATHESRSKARERGRVAARLTAQGIYRGRRRLRRARLRAARSSLLVVLALIAFGLIVASSARSAPPANFQTSLIMGDGLNGPSGFDIAPDGRIFILERSGKIKIVKDGQLLPTPFADLPSEDTGDRGLIGIAFDPDFGVSNHYVYFYYTGHDLLNHLVRYSAADDVGTNGPFELFRTTSPSHLLHVGGSIRFGPDGKLYFAVGDNGNGANAQDLSSPHGKIMRINKDGSIPDDNPFAGQPGKLGAIWAYGFRNPWRFQFDSATGRLYDGDVGDYSWEEINRIVKGGNYGWPLHEGTCQTNCAGFIDPTYAYPHAGESSSITAGPVYRGGMFPEEYQGDFFFGDYAKGFIRNADLDANGDVTAVHEFDEQAGSVVDFKVAPDGSLYYLTYYPGALYRVTYNTTSHLPVAGASADVTKGIEPLTVHFSSAGSRDPDGDPLSYHWTFGDGTSSAEANPTKTYTEKGVYTARLTVSANGDDITAQPIVIQAGLPPELTVASPTEGQLYRAGDTITYNAFARDAAGFDLDDGDIKTEVRLHHGTHFHPFVGPITGRAGSFTIPTTGEPSADTSYEIKVTATDGNGLFTSKIVNIFPRKSEISLATDPPGLGVAMDAIPVSTPRTITGVEGFRRELSAPSSAVAQDGTRLQFAGWSDGKRIRHLITTPVDDTTYTARYVPLQPFAAKYYANTSLSGTPVLNRQDGQINFAWGGGSPDPSLPDNGFSVHWTKTQWFGAGRYTFTALADDGVRLYVDGKRVINQWQGPANTEFDYTTDLGEGNHRITMDYVEYGGDATAMLTWDAAPDQPSDAWRAEYWNAPPGPYAIPATTADVVRDEEAIDHAWGSGSPDPTIGSNRFLARWTRTMSFAPGDYEFAATADDGVRLYVDGAPVIDKWIDEGPTTYKATLPMDGGPHKIVMEYYENGGDALAKLEHHRVSDADTETPWHGEYWNNVDGWPPTIPARPAELERDDDTLDFDWAEGSPGGAIGSNMFVARWTKTVKLSAGVYRFSGVRDDGIRAYIDNVPVVDQWTLGHESYSVDKVVTAGTHELRVEYFEAGSDAVAGFSYDRIAEWGPTDGGYAAEYFANRDLAGTPVLTRNDAAIDFNWGAGAPADGVPADNFSARWTKTLSLDEAGGYKFTVTSDDGVRLFVDGQKVLDKWTFQSQTTHSVNVGLTQGAHEIVLEYFDASGDAVARFRYEPTSEPAPPLPPPAGAYAGEYFGNRDLAGTPVLTRNDEKIDFDWGAGGPGGGVPTDNFSARWTRSLTVPMASFYEFSVTADDGVRLLVDGTKILDKWITHSGTTYTVTRELAQGSHQIVLEYFEAGADAVAKLDYEVTPVPPPPPEPFSAEYFDNMNLSGTPVLTRSDDAIDFDWGESSPNFAVPANTFSARWTRTKSYPAGTYRMSVTGDDGIRVLVDGEVVVDGWFYQPPTTYTADVPLSEGEHTVVIEYFEFSGGAIAKFSEYRLG
jgi:glucose/arabinose dehydrogenase